MDPNVPTPERAPSLLRMLDAALQIGLVGLLIFACSRIILPFTSILLWSVILAVMSERSRSAIHLVRSDECVPAAFRFRPTA